MLLLIACLKVDQLPDIELENTSPFIAFPVANLKLTSDELIEQLDGDVDIDVNAEGIYTVTFTSDPFIQTKEDLFPKTNFGLPIPIFDSVVTLPVPNIAELSLETGVLKGDQMIFTLNSLENSDVKIKLRLPQLTKTNEPYEQEFIIPFDGAAPSTFVSPPIDLEGYSVDFSKDNLTLIYDARREDGQRIVLPLSFAQITAFDFSYLEGHIAQTNLPTGLQRVDIDIQDSLLEGSYQFQNPKINFDIANSFGIPIGIQVKDVFIIGGDLIPQPLNSSLFDDILYLDYPQYDEKGQVVRERITFDKNNSNLLELTHNDIIAIDYNLDIIINPANSDDNRFFVLDSSRAVLTAEVELSLEAIVEAVTVEKKVGINFSRLDSLEFIRLKVVIDNGLPLSFEPRLVMRDTIGQVEMNLQEEAETPIASADTDNLGNVINSRQSTLYYTLSKDQLLVSQTMNQLEATFILRSPNEGTISTRIKPGQELLMRMGAEAKLK